MDEILNHGPCGFLSFDQDGTIRQVNATLAQMIDREQEALIGTRLEKILTVGGRIFYQTHVFPLLKLHGFANEIYLTLATPRGDLSVLLNAVRRHRDGETVFDCAIFAIPHRGQFEDELIKSKRSAEESAIARDQFLAVVSHELRTPLNAIVGWAHLMRMSDGNPEMIQQGLEVIERNAKVQTRLIEDLIDVSRVVSGKLRLDVSTVDLIDVIKATLDVARPGAEAKSISIHTILDPNAGPVSGDPSRLQQVLWNLLSNAVKFTPKNGTIQIRLQRTRSHAEIVVTDSGQGIAPEFLPYVFDRFRQATDASLAREGGLGLGMAITKEIVELHGGSIRVESEGVGRGTTFFVALPVLAVQSRKPDVSDLAANDRSEQRSPVLTGLRVLIAEDAADARDFLAATLLRAGAEVIVTKSAGEAFTALMNARPTILVSDIEMPGEDGVALMRRIRSSEDDHLRTTPAVALTANGRFADRIRILSAGYQAHITKPVEPDELTVVIANLCDRQRG